MLNFWEYYSFTIYDYFPQKDSLGTVESHPLVMNNHMPYSMKILNLQQLQYQNGYRINISLHNFIFFWDFCKRISIYHHVPAVIAACWLSLQNLWLCPRDVWDNSQKPLQVGMVQVHWAMILQTCLTKGNKWSWKTHA